MEPEGFHKIKRFEVGSVYSSKQWTMIFVTQEAGARA